MSGPLKVNPTPHPRLQTGSGNGAVEAVRAPQIDEELARLKTNVSHLDAALGNLETRLARVLRPEEPQKDTDSKASSVVSLASEIRESAWFVDLLAQRVGSLLERLEL